MSAIMHVFCHNTIAITSTYIYSTNQHSRMGNVSYHISFLFISLFAMLIDNEDNNTYYDQQWKW